MNITSEIERQKEAAIDALRLKAFETNSDADRQAYFDAVSKWFQDRHIRRMNAERALSSPDHADAGKVEGEGWLPIESAPEGVAVETKIDDESGERNIQALVKRTRIPGETRPMFWLTDGSMYVYYEPTHWRPLPTPPSGEVA